MNPILIGIIGILVLIAVMFFLKLPVGFAMMFVGFLGVCYVISPDGISCV